MEWTWLKDWWRLKKWHYRNKRKASTFDNSSEEIADVDTNCYCDECFVRNDILTKSQ